MNLDELTIVVQRGKGGKRRVVGLDVGTALMIDQWLASQKKLGIASKAPVFGTLDGRPLDYSYVRHLMPRRAKKAGISKHIHAHGLRHRFDVDLVEEGGDLFVARDLLGHASAATTQVYLSRIGTSDAIAFARGRERKGV